jgi:hypothetical protein
VGLFDHIAPSERAADLRLTVNRLRRHTGLAVVPMLVVEGPADEAVFGGVCCHGERQIFPAGNRDLVEQLLRHLKREPVKGCECVFLIDCDGKGKTLNLARVGDLVVTETCDMEADLVRLGIAERVARRYLDSDEHAREVLTRSCSLAMSVSVIRRAAEVAGISMKKKNRQMRLSDLPEDLLDAWERQRPSDHAVVEAVGHRLGWAPAQGESVKQALGGIRRDFDRTCLGKDALDALFRLLQREGRGDVRGWSREYFHKAVRDAILVGDIERWEVGRRIQDWEHRTGHSLLAPTAHV